MPERGKYIVIEGNDGTGKTTQASLLQEHLVDQGVDVIHIKEPGGSPVAEAIRNVILDGTLPRTPTTNALLFTANRHELWHAIIQPALAVGTWVICTRNYWSTLAYQGYGEGMSLDAINTMTAAYTDENYMHPDVGVILAFDDFEERRRRIAERGELDTPDTFEMQRDDFQTKVNQAYIDIATERNLPIIDASQTIVDIQQEIRDLIAGTHRSHPR